jgi:hypothetical protein
MKQCWGHSHDPSIRSHRGTKVVLTRFPANESSRRTGSQLSLSEKSSFCLPALQISRSCRTASENSTRTPPPPKKRDVVYLGWPIAPSYMSTALVNEYSCAHSAQINFGDLLPYLTWVVFALSNVVRRHLMWKKLLQIVTGVGTSWR